MDQIQLTAGRNYTLTSEQAQISALGVTPIGNLTKAGVVTVLA